MKQLMENTSVQSGPAVLVQLDQIFLLTTSKPDELENARTLHFDASLSLYSVGLSFTGVEDLNPLDSIIDPCY